MRGRARGGCGAGGTVRLFDALTDLGHGGKNPFACDVGFDGNVRSEIFSVAGDERERKLRSEWKKFGRHLHAVRGARFEAKIFQVRIQILAKGAGGSGVRLFDGIARWQTTCR